MKSIKTYIGVIAIAITTLIGISSNAQTIVTNTYTGPVVAGTFTNNTVGSYYGYMRPTNSVGSIWIASPTNSYFAFADIITIDTNLFAISALKLGQMTPVYGTNYVDFAVTNHMLYQYIVYFRNKPVNTNVPVSVQIKYLLP